MPDTEIANDIAELNTALLLLAQKMLRLHRPKAMLQLGASGAAADFILGLTPARIRSMAESSALLCELRGGNALPIVFSSAHDARLQRAHHFIVLAGHHGTRTKTYKRKPPHDQQERPAGSA